MNPFKSVQQWKRDHDQREAQSVSDHAAFLTECNGAKDLSAIARMMRRRGRVATQRTFWVFGALLATIFIALIYYVGLPLITQFSQVTMNSYEAEVRQQNLALQRMDDRRDAIWAEAVSAAEHVLDTRSDPTGTQVRTFDLHTIGLRGSPAVMARIERIVQMKRLPGKPGDDAMLFALAEDEMLRLEMGNPEFESVFLPLHARIAGLTQERAERERALAAARQRMEELRLGTASTVTRRNDYLDFMKHCVGVGEGDTLTSCQAAYEFTETLAIPDVWELVAERLPQAVLLLFLLATLSPLYRYNMRMAGFHHARADVVEMMALRRAETGKALSPEDLAEFLKLADVLAADKVEFGKANTPTDQAVELAKAIANR